MNRSDDSQFDAALFDMDGTLVNSIATVEAMWTRFAQWAELSAGDVIRYSHGRQIADSIARFLPDRSLAEQHRIVRRLMREEIEQADAVTEIAGAARFVETLLHKEIPVALVTSAVRQLAVARMQHAGVPVPPVIVAAEDADRGKPAPDAYLQAAALLGVPTSRCIAFEDAEAGLRSALSAGVHVVVVGDHVSPTSEGLPRISDYRDVRVAVDAPGFRLSLSPVAHPPQGRRQ